MRSRAHAASMFQVSRRSEPTSRRVRRSRRLPSAFTSNAATNISRLDIQTRQRRRREAGQLKRRTPLTRVSLCFKSSLPHHRSACHSRSQPRRAIPHHANPEPNRPNQSLPDLSFAHRTNPFLTPPRLAKPFQRLPRPTGPRLASPLLSTNRLNSASLSPQESRTLSPETARKWGGSLRDQSGDLHLRSVHSAFQC